MLLRVDEKVTATERELMTEVSQTFKRLSDAFYVNAQTMNKKLTEQ